VLSSETTMRRRLMVFLLTLAPCLLAGPLALHAQQPAKMPRIGWLSPTSGPQPPSAAFQQGLRDLGWIEGQNIAIEYRWAAGNFEHLSALAVELAQLPVEVIVTVGLPATVAAQHATPAIPIVFVAISDPLESGLVRSLAQPGGHITGISDWNEVLMGKRLELLKEVVPGLSRVAALWYKARSTGGTPSALRELEHAAGALAIPLDIMEVQGLQALEGDGSALNTTQADALIVLPSALFYQQRARLVELLAQHRLPAMYAAREFVEAGGLLAYGPFLPDLFRRAATYVDKILKGAKPADLPVEQPTKLEFVINLKAAQALGLTISPMLLFRADEVIR
jgi:putative tryptophan/tyrosine transport system substrate-binding protein